MSPVEATISLITRGTTFDNWASFLFDGGGTPVQEGPIRIGIYQGYKPLAIITESQNESVKQNPSNPAGERITTVLEIETATTRYLRALHAPVGFYPTATGAANRRQIGQETTTRVIFETLFLFNHL